MVTGVLDGQSVNASNTNAAFLAKNGDDTAEGKVGLANTDPVSGESVTNVQRELSALRSTLGIPANQAKTYLITWFTDFIGAANDTVRERIDQIVLFLLGKFHNVSGHNHDRSGGNGPVIAAKKLFVYSSDADFDLTKPGMIAEQGDTYFNSTLDTARIYTSLGWVSVGSGAGSGEGGINYTSESGGNHNAETSASGWVGGNASLVSGVPTSLSSGTPTATWTRTAILPVRGAGSFLFTAGGLGDYFYKVHTPARGCVKRGAWQSIQAEIEALGTIADGAYQVWVEVTHEDASKTIIQPTGFKIPGSVANAVFKPANVGFQLPTTTATFKVAIMQAVASPGANLKVDSVSVGPVSQTLGAFIGDSKQYSSPTTSGFGTISGTSIHYRREGDHMRAWGFFVSGTPTASAATFTLPDAVVVSSDSSKISQTTRTIVGRWARTSSGASTPKGGVLHTAGGNNSIAFGFDDYTTALSPLSVQNGNTICNAGETIEIEFFVPISGWGSSMVLSSSSDEGRIVSLNATKASGTHTSSGSFQDITSYSAVGVDRFGRFDASTGVYTLAVPGDYIAVGEVTFDPSSTGVRYVALDKGGAIFATGSAAGLASVQVVATTAGLISGNANDQIKMRAYQNSGGNLAYGTCRISLFKLSGSQTIAASESVNVRASTTTAISLTNNAEVTIVYNNENFDSHGWYDATTGVFTAGVPGKFDVFARLRTVAYTGSPNSHLIRIYKGAVLYAQGGQTVPSVSGSWAAEVSDTVDLLAGETITIKGFQDSGAARALNGVASDNRLSIKRVGN